MADVGSWVPMRWPSGGEWSAPGSLALLDGTPVSCLVLAWAEGGEEDAARQRGLAALVAAARARGLAVVGWVAAGADLRGAAASAEASGLSALATESAQPLAGAGVLRFRPRGLGDRSHAGFVGSADLGFPGLRDATPDGADAVSGPTGPPWLDSNAWWVRLARALVRPEVVWLAFDPPDRGRPLEADAYVRAIADSETFGARWVLRLDPHLVRGLAAARPAALATFHEIAAALGFFREHRAWARFSPVAQLGVVSDFAGRNEFLSFEVLNLLGRQNGLYRVIEKAGAVEAALDGLDAVLYVDDTPPAPDLARRLNAFAEAGGTLVTPPGWDARGATDDGEWPRRFRVSGLGRGRVAVAKDELADPFVLAEDAQLLMSHRHDRLRVFNPGTTQLHYLASPGDRAGVLHAVRHDAPDPRAPTTVWFRQRWTRARAVGVGAARAVDVAPTPAEPGVELALPPLPVYCALEVSS